MDWLRGLMSLIERGIEFVTWRDDWNRTWSPVSFWLAVTSLLVLLVLAVLYGHEAWQHLARFLSSGP